MGPETNNGNGETKINVAVLQEQYRAIAHDMGEIKALLGDKCKRWDEDHERIVKLEGEVTRVKDKQTLGSWAQGGLTLIASTIAAWLGMRP